MSLLRLRRSIATAIKQLNPGARRPSQSRVAGEVGWQEVENALQRKNVMRKIVFAIFLAGFVMTGGNVCAAELVMFEDPGCGWCRRWHTEVGPAYPRTAEGRVAPLRRVHIREQSRSGVLLERPIVATPTFVLTEKSREIGRIVGYPGEEFFYGQLENLLKSTPRQNSSTPAMHILITP